MKKQLLTIAMLVSVFAAGNVLAASGDEGAKDTKKTTQNDGEGENGGSNKNANANDDANNNDQDSNNDSDSTDDSSDNNDGESTIARVGNALKSPFVWTWNNKVAFTSSAAFGAAVALVASNFDKIVAKNADVEDEDEDEEDDA